MGSGAEKWMRVPFRKLSSPLLQVLPRVWEQDERVLPILGRLLPLEYGRH